MKYRVSLNDEGDHKSFDVECNEIIVGPTMLQFVNKSEIPEDKIEEYRTGIYSNISTVALIPVRNIQLVTEVAG